jgi:hypothetical protein
MVSKFSVGEFALSLRQSGGLGAFARSMFSLVCIAFRRNQSAIHG